MSYREPNYHRSRGKNFNRPNGGDRGHYNRSHEYRNGPNYDRGPPHRHHHSAPYNEQRHGNYRPGPRNHHQDWRREGHHGPPPHHARYDRGIHPEDRGPPPHGQHEPNFVNTPNQHESHPSERPPPQHHHQPPHRSRPHQPHQSHQPHKPHKPHNPHHHHVPFQRNGPHHQENHNHPRHQERPSHPRPSSNRSVPHAPPQPPLSVINPFPLVSSISKIDKTYMNDLISKREMFTHKIEKTHNHTVDKLLSIDILEGVKMEAKVVAGTKTVIRLSRAIMDSKIIEPFDDEDSDDENPLAQEVNAIIEKAKSQAEAS